MKKLLLLLAIGGGGYYYYTAHMQAGAATVDSYQALLKKVEVTPVSRDEVIFGANNLASFLCNGGGSGVSECLSKYENYKEMCENRIFGNAPDTYSSKSEVVSVAKSYTSCVGIR